MEGAGLPSFFGPGKSAVCVAKQLARNQIFGERSDIDCDKRPVFARAGVVNGSGQHFFAGACFAQEQRMGERVGGDSRRLQLFLVQRAFRGDGWEKCRLLLGGRGSRASAKKINPHRGSSFCCLFLKGPVFSQRILPMFVQRHPGADAESFASKPGGKHDCPGLVEGDEVLVTFFCPKKQEPAPICLGLRERARRWRGRLR